MLLDLLVDNKGEILSAWIDQVLATYPKDASRIFKREKDRFANPVGHGVRHSLEALYQAVFETDEVDVAQVGRILEEIVKIRAVQTFTPSQAVSFVYSLKDVVKAECCRKDAPEIALADWQAFEAKVDTLAYQAFDLYMACRERLYEVRIKEIKSGNFMMIEGGCCPSAAMKKDNKRKVEI